jgi:hypothetical protein
MGTSTSYNPMGLQSLLQGYLLLVTVTYFEQTLYSSLYNDDFHSLDYIDIMAASLKKREYEKI